jgi:ParB-like chromosome segregation protein Spo0J
MEDYMEIMAIEELVCESNRKYTKDPGWEQFVSSIREYGVIEPIVVRKTDDGAVKVVDGRRRVQASREA